MKKKLFLLVAISSVVFTSCQKEAVNPNKPANTPQASALKSQNSSLNPYDFVGDIHNSILDGISQLPTFPNETAEQDYNIAVAEAEKNFPGEKVQSLQATQASLALIAGLTFDEVIDKLYNDGLMSSKQRTLFKVIGVNVETSGEDANLLNSRLIAFENSLFHRNDITDEEKAPLFGVVAILKSSSMYWSNAKDDVNNPWHDLGGSLRKPVWLADSIGWVDGFFTPHETFPHRLDDALAVAGIYSANAGRL